jgi:ATP-dependent Clp protease protease subunit
MSAQEAKDYGIIDEIFSPRHTGQPMEKIMTDTDRNFFMSAQEAKDYGIIDEIFSPRK